MEVWRNSIFDYSFFFGKVRQCLQEIYASYKRKHVPGVGADKGRPIPELQPSYLSSSSIARTK